MGEIDQYLNGRKASIPSKKDDAFPDVCNLEVFIPSEYADPIPVICNLELGFVNENLNGQNYEIGVSAVKLRLKAEGYTVNKANKFGAIQSGKTLQVRTDQQKSSGKNSKKSGNLSLPFNASLSSENQTAKNETQNYSASYEHHYVTAIANDCWVIRTPDESTSYLQGSLIPGVALCYIQPVGQSNRKRVSLRVEIPPDQLKLKPSGGGISKLKHHKLIQMFIYKQMREGGKAYLTVDEDTSFIPASVIDIEDGED